MPRSWPRKPDRQTDPQFRRAEDMMNFIVHVMVFLAINSGIWFFHNIYRSDSTWDIWFTGAWFAIVLLHITYIRVIADYSEAS